MNGNLKEGKAFLLQPLREGAHYELYQAQVQVVQLNI